jgi:hypothetical protein
MRLATGCNRYEKIKAINSGPMMLENRISNAATMATMVKATTSFVVEFQRGDVGGRLVSSIN